MTVLTAEHRAYLSEVEAVTASFEEQAYTWEGALPRDNIRALADAGVYCPSIDAEYGGGGHSDLHAILLSEAVARACPDTGWYTYLQCMVGPKAIDLFGTDEVKSSYLPGVTAGEDIISIAISEPDAGSDVKSMQTTVTEADDGLSVSGEKMWVGGVPYATAAVTWVKFEEGLGSVVLPMDDPGVSVIEEYENSAGYIQTHFQIDDVWIPESYVLTRGREAFKQQLISLNWERLGASAVSLGWAVAALEKALGYSQQREQFGGPLTDNQGIQWKLAEMYRQIETTAATIYAAAASPDDSAVVPDRIQTSVAKLQSSQIVEEVVSEAVQLVGARAFQQGHDLEYLYRLARGRRIAAGTDEMMLNTVARALLRDGVPGMETR